MNRYTIIGNLGRDAEVKHLNEGKLVTTFSIAVTETWKDKQTGEKKSRTDWIDCDIWGGWGEKLAKYLVKGKKILVEGRPYSRAYVNKENKAVGVLGVRVDSVEFLGGAAKESSSDQEPAAEKSEEDDSPF